MVYNIEELKKILEENAGKDINKEKVKFNEDLFVNKINFERVFYEHLIKQYTKLDESIVEAYDQFVKALYKIYEENDLYPYVFGADKLEENDLLTENLLNKKVSAILESVKADIVNKIKKLIEENTSKDTIKELLTEGYSTEEIQTYLVKYTYLSELIDRIAFPNLNKIKYKNKELQSLEEYQQAKDKFVKSILNKG